MTTTKPVISCLTRDLIILKLRKYQINQKDLFVSEVEKEENLVKKTCRELGITQKELAEILEVTPHTITNWSKYGMDKTTKTALEGLVYKNKFKEIQENIIDFKNFSF